MIGRVPGETTERHKFVTRFQNCQICDICGKGLYRLIHDYEEETT